MTTHYRELTDPGHRSDVVSMPMSDSAAITFSGLVYRNGIKPILDLVAIAVALPVVLPVVAILAVIIFLRDGGNPFYTQDRVGKNGRLYRIWKLRTMVVNADQKLEAYLAANPAARREWDETQKLKTDPRITRFGRILRKCSLDELPQLWNVVRGEMSLVGPRPMMPDQQDLYPSKVYYDMRPGITGYWQISDRNETSFADRARFDTWYNHDMSLVTDLRVLLDTVRVVVRGTGY